MLCVLTLAAAIAGVAPLDARIHAVAALSGQPRLVAAAGLTKGDQTILTLENDEAFDPSSQRRRVVVIGGFDGDDNSALAVLDFVRWFKTRAPAAVRRNWALSALPAAAFDPADAASLERWVTFQAADLLVEVRDGRDRGDVKVLPPVIVNAKGASQAIAALLTSAPRTRSALHEAMVQRVARDPLAVARLLSGRYPEAPSISYIPSVAWVSTLRLATLLQEPAIAGKVHEQTMPWVSGGRALFGDRIQLTAIAGAMVFTELGGEARPRALEAAALASARKENGYAQYGQGWTDDMFMTSAILARTGVLPGRTSDLDAAAQLVGDYAARLQRADGLFMHATDGPFAWGRGNGFAALGLTETLTRLPAAHPARANLLSIYRRHMAALVRHQSPDGTWRQVIDEPGAYREESATAMVLVAMARGIRMGWLAPRNRPAVERAWRALAAHVSEDGTVIDVCAGTGAGPTRRYYLDRPAVTGADDRGGAMALAAAVEFEELRRLSSRRRAGSSSAEPIAR